MQVILPLTALAEVLRGHQNVDVERMVRRLLDMNEAMSTVSIGDAIDDNYLTWGELEDEIFDVLVADERIKIYLMSDRIPASRMVHILDRIMHKLPHLLITLNEDGVLRTKEANRIFSKLQSDACPKGIGFLVSNGSSLPAVGRFVQDHSSLRGLAVFFDDSLFPVSEADFRALCNGVAKSSSLTNVIISGLPAEGTEPTKRATQALADAIAESRCLIKVFARNDEFLQDRIGRAISETDAAKNFDIMFHESENDVGTVVTLHRTNPWKPLLPQNISLALWPNILAKTNTWNEVTSHTSLDALFFLLREKCDVLFRNTKQLSGRKRKREHAESDNN